MWLASLAPTKAEVAAWSAAATRTAPPSPSISHRTTGGVFLQYGFCSEEYNEFVNSQFNDEYQLLLNGTHVAMLPGGAGVVSIISVNWLVNSRSTVTTTMKTAAVSAEAAQPH